MKKNKVMKHARVNNVLRKAHPLIQFLHRERIVKDVNQEVLQKRIGCSKNSLSWWETGRHTPRLMGFIDWANALGFDVVLKRALPYGVTNVFLTEDADVSNEGTVYAPVAARSTCEICDHNELADCRSCGLSGDPNPEAFSREQVVRALVLEARIKEAILSSGGAS